MNLRKFDPGLILVAVIVLILGGLGIFIFNQLRTDEVANRVTNSKEIPVLLIVQNEKHILLSHVLILHPKTHRMAMIDIPDNLGAIIGALGRVDSLDALYREKGREAYMKHLSQLLDLEIPFWLELSLDEVRHLADFLSGLPIFTPDSVDLTGKDGKLFRIPSGQRILDGDKTADFLSVTIPNEQDVAKNNRRSAFTKALLARLSEAKSQVQKGAFLAYLSRFMVGNMDDHAIGSYVKLLGDVNFDSMITQRILGNTRSVETSEGTKSLLFPHFEGQLVKDGLRLVLNNLGSADEAKDGSAVRLEILNGTDQPGLARKASDLYQNYGYQIVKMGNTTPATTLETQVVDRKGNQVVAERVAKIIRGKKIINQPTSTPPGPDGDVDVTIILGKDFDGYYVK